MQAKYLNRYNEETNQTEQFYPITHADAVIGAASKDYVDNALAGVSVTLESMGVTATATELNYVDGVTSNIQEQFNDVTARLFDLETVANALAQI